MEFLHRGRRQGQLAFLLAVNSTVPDSAAPAAPSWSSPSSDAAPSISSFSSAGGVGAAAATDGTGAVGKPSKTTGDGAGAGADADAVADMSANATASTKPSKIAADGAMERGDGSLASPSLARLPSPPPAWICVRTGRELSGVVQAYRESVAGSVAAGSWLSKPRPRVIGHMGTADQVRTRGWLGSAVL